MEVERQESNHVLLPREVAAHLARMEMDESVREIGARYGLSVTDLLGAMDGVISGIKDDVITLMSARLVKANQPEPDEIKPE